MSSPSPKPALVALALDGLRRWLDAFEPTSPSLALYLVALRFRSLCLLEARGPKALGAQAAPG